MPPTMSPLGTGVRTGPVKDKRSRTGRKQIRVGRVRGKDRRVRVRDRTQPKNAGGVKSMEEASAFAETMQSQLSSESLPASALTETMESQLSSSESNLISSSALTETMESQTLAETMESQTSAVLTETMESQTSSALAETMESQTSSALAETMETRTLAETMETQPSSSHMEQGLAEIGDASITIPYGDTFVIAICAGVGAAITGSQIVQTSLGEAMTLDELVSLSGDDLTSRFPITIQRGSSHVATDTDAKSDVTEADAQSNGSAMSIGDSSAVFSDAGFSRMARKEDDWARSARDQLDEETLQLIRNRHGRCLRYAQILSLVCQVRDFKLRQGWSLDPLECIDILCNGDDDEEDVEEESDDDFSIDEEQEGLE